MTRLIPGRDRPPSGSPPLRLLTSPLATAGQDAAALWAAYRRAPGHATRDRLVLHYHSLVRAVVRRTVERLPGHVELADLVQSGVFGLLEAIERYDPSRCPHFESYAVPRIRGAVLDELRAQDWVPRVIRNRARELAKARESVEARLQRSATPAELAGELGVGPAEVFGILSQIQVISLDALDEWAAATGSTVTLAETLAQDDSDPTTVLEARETSRLLALSFAQLPERDHQVLWSYYVENLTLAEIGRRLGVTESRVCQLRGRAIARLREKFNELTGSVAESA
jgi:RNA polymerase sigma factor for flagellar operon FliA